MSYMLEDKKYYFMIEPTKSCRLSFSARWLYSFLVYRSSLNKPAAEACMVRNPAICNRAVKKYLGELRDAGLLAEVNGNYLASEPATEMWSWFVRKGNAGALPWFRQFATYAVYVPNPRQGMPLSHSALLSLVWSLRHGSGWQKIRPAALATMLFPEMHRDSAKRQINRAARSLREKGLLDDGWNVTVQEAHFHYWRDADHFLNPRSRTEVDQGSLRTYVVGCMEKVFPAMLFHSIYTFGMHIERCEQLMKKAGYNQRQIIDFWDEVIFEADYCNKMVGVVEAFAKGFPTLLKVAEEITADNRISRGYVGISLGLLRKLSKYECLKIKDMAAKKNSNGESLLKYYEPDMELTKAKMKVV